MRFVYFTHSLMSCWNNGNAHFLRGVLRELLHRGHDVHSYEPVDGWSRMNLLREAGENADQVDAELLAHADFLTPDLDAMLDSADVVLVHEWNDPALIEAIGRRRARGGRFVLLFHDTHHRAVTDPEAIGRLDLSAFDGVLAFGETLARVYREAGWGARCFVWHEAADTRLFHPPATEVEDRRDVVWVGNWGDEERSQELSDFLLHPVQDLRLKLDVYGVRYPQDAQARLAQAGAHYRGWLPNARVPDVFARYLMTAHIPRRAYATQLAGIPTIRVFEALACGIPLICAPWNDMEYLFRPGIDYLQAATPDEMRAHMASVAADAGLRHSMTAHGLETIRARHTCAHRVDELLATVAHLNVQGAA
ncbi:CgeB family protein [Rhodopila sp.]|uniref:CgeB family protein n=1 Tax=Rhodopila sp. TaxID=2480087 RepID=UPI003D0A3FAD